MTRALVIAVLMVAIAGCEEGSSGRGGAEPPASESASESASASAPAPAPASASAPALASALAPAPATRGPARGTVASDGGKPSPTCGDKPLPPCPLYAWMKANTSPAMSAEDYDSLSKALDKVVGFAPPGYTNWASISRDGANAARMQSLDGVKASCRGCHKQYKDRYKKEMRDRGI